MKIQTLNLIGQNGEKVPEGITAHDREKLFPPMGIVKVVALEWALPDGILHTLSLLTEAKKISWEMLPDRSGFLLVANSETNSEAWIMNADESTRCNLENPLLASNFYENGDTVGFSYPGVDRGQLGCYVYIWSPSKSQPDSGVSGEYFFAIDLATNQFTDSHLVK
jgi:hypothetical protein